MDYNASYRIIVRMPNWIGDLVMATPLLTDLRHTFPYSHITVMSKQPASELLKEDPDIDELFCFTTGSKLQRRIESRNITAKLRQGKYDIGILLPLSLSSAWYFWMGKVHRRIGYAKNLRKMLLTDPVVFPNIKQHLVVTYKMVLAPLGIPVSETNPRLFLLPREIMEGREHLQRLGILPSHRIIGINPGAAYGPAKCWLPSRFQAVTKELLRDPLIRVIYFGDESSIPLIKHICQEFPSTVVNLAGLTTLREASAFIQLCSVFLTNDTGLMHVAAALQVPLVALFGSTSDTITAPYKTGVVIHKHPSCSPCYRRTCPTDFRCMKQIQVAEVCDAIKSLFQ